MRLAAATLLLAVLPGCPCGRLTSAEENVSVTGEPAARARAGELDQDECLALCHDGTSLAEVDACEAAVPYEPEDEDSGDTGGGTDPGAVTLRCVGRTREMCH